MKTISNQFFTVIFAINKKLFLFAIILILSLNVIAQTNTWSNTAGGNWNVKTNWSRNEVPTNLQDVIIPSNITGTITINIAAVCKTITVKVTTANSLITISGSNSLTVSGALKLEASTANNISNTFDVQKGSLICTSVSMDATNNTNRQTYLRVSTGNIEVNGNINMGDINNSVVFNGAGNLYIDGNITGGKLVPSTGTVTFQGATNQIITGANTVSFYNLIIDKTTVSKTVTSTTNAMDIAGSCSIKTGNLILQASNDDYSISKDLNIEATGKLTHSVNWDTYGKLLSVGGNINVDGIISYTVRSHIQMNGTGTKYLRTGDNPASGFCVLTLKTGNYYANGNIVVNDNFWPMYYTTGSFHTAGNDVIAKASVLCAGGTFFVDGGSATITGGANIAFGGSIGALTVSAGTLTTDALNMGDDNYAATGTHKGGVININGNLFISVKSKIICSNFAEINITGNWTSNNAAGFTQGNSTVTFKGTGDQFINGTDTDQPFYNVIIDKGTSSLSSGGSTTTLSFNDLTITKGKLSASALMNVTGDWTNNDSFLSNTGKVIFKGTIPQLITGSISTSFNELTITNGNNITLGLNTSVTGGTNALTFTNGKIITGSNILKLGSAATISGASSARYVNGNLEMGIPTGNLIAKTYTIGDDNSYTPVVINFDKVNTVGTLMLSTTGSDHPLITGSDLDETKSVNRYYSLTGSNFNYTNYSSVFNFVAGDVDAGASTSDFIIGGNNSGAWFYPTTTAKNSTNIKANSLSSFGNFSIAEGGAGIPTVQDNPENTSACTNGSTEFNVAFLSKPEGTIVWQVSTNNGSTFSNLTLSGSYSAVSGSNNNIVSGTLTINPVTAAMNNYIYRAVITNSRGSKTSAGGKLSLSASPTATIGATLSSICANVQSVNLNGSVTNATGGLWTSNAGGSFIPSATTLNAKWLPDPAYSGTASLTLSTVGGCKVVSVSKNQVVKAAPVFTISGDISVCQFSGVKSISTSPTGNMKWSPVTNLYTDAAATNAYTGTSNTTVYFKTDVAFSRVYTATYTAASGCTASKDVSVTVLATPVISVGTDYCYGDGKIKLTVDSDIPATYVWNTGETTSSILVDLAKGFSVVATAANGCKSDTSSLIIGLELIDNGDFEAGNIGFSSAYTYVNKTVANGLNPEQTYTVNNNPTANHSNFWGRDHTSGSGQFMIINGSGSNPPINVWSKTLTVTPNTDYYFSAWAISLNSVGPYADLQFKVNGTQVGTTTGALPARPNDNNPPYNWIRFYGTWNSGAATTANVSIVDLITVAGGNDFGIDDISFGTLTPFITITSLGRDTQTVCKNGSIQPIKYAIGGMEAGPLVTGLPAGVTSAYSAGILTITGTPTIPGVYTYEVKSRVNCIQATKIGIITVEEEKMILSSAAGTNNQMACFTPITPIKYTISGSGTGATVTGLPAGVTGSFSAGVFTISGTPSATGTFNYTVNSTGRCVSVSLNGTITVQNSTITLSSAASTTSQSVCVSTGITAIKYTIAGVASGATVTGLPVGITGSYSGGVLTITGSSTVAGSYSYTVNTTGSCAAIPATGSITIVAPTISLNSAAATANQTICLSSAITAIKYNIGGNATGATVSGLPSGVTGSYNAGIFTISGTPTLTGDFSFTVSTTTICSPVTMSGTIKVQNSTITLSSAASTTSQSVCVSTGITAIKYTIGGVATGATVSGLPAGITGSYSAGVLTISGSATGAGSYSYTVNTTGSCPASPATGSMTIVAPTISLNSAAATANQTLCLSSAITAIKYNIGGNATGATVSGLPSGVTESYNAGIFTITGTPTVAGDFSYTVSTTTICSPVTMSGTIKVQNSTITLSSAASTTSQSVCVSTGITAIKYTIGGVATGATVTGLPAGITGSYSAGILTISGSSAVTGDYNYTVSTTGSCAATPETGTITIVAPAISLNSAAATTNQTLCLTSAITAIKYNIGGNATGATVTGLPSGVTGSYSAGIFTLSGTPTVAGDFSYTVSTTSICSPVTMTGTIKVQNSTITLSSAASTTSQSVCVSTGITAIKYTIGGVATGATVTGLPAGITGSYSAGVLTISGSSATTGNYNYTVSTTGSCAATPETGSITIVAPTISLNSAAPTANQTLCLSSAITDIKYNIGGNATGATVTGLPGGVTGSYNAGIFTISGTPSSTGTFNYTVKTTGICTAVSMTGTIKVETESLTLTSGDASATQTLCINQAIIPATFAVEGSAPTVTGLPAGIVYNFSGGVLTISGTPTVSGSFNLSITTTGNCSHANISQALFVYPKAVGGSLPSKSLCSGGIGNIVLTGHVGTIDHWETSTDSLTWNVVANNTNTLNYNNPGYAMFYRVLVKSGTCTSEYSSVARIGIHNLWTGLISNDWMNPYNWSDALLPTLSCANITIPVSPNYPVLPAGTVTVNNLVIGAGATLHTNEALLQIAGTITGGGKICSDSSTIELNGNSAQVLSGLMFTNNIINNLKISNNNNVTISGSDTLKLQGEVSFGKSNAKMYANNNFTLLSTSKGTASILDMTAGGQFSGNDIIGSVTVERYIPKHPKAWQLLAVPTKGSTIQQSWQEGNVPLGNNVPGRGIILTGDVAGAVSKGFDISTPAGPGIKTYNSNTNTWVGVAATTIGIANKKGYLVMVRGDRSVYTSTAPATEITLRTMGQLYTTGTNAPEVTTIDSAKMESVGNPYACAVDFSKITKTGGVADFFYVWDPLLTNAGQSAYGLGGYQVFTRAGATYQVTPGGGSYKGGNTMIESGQAIIISSPYAAGTVTFTEAAKVSGSNIVSRPANNWQMLRANIYTNAAGARVLVDGVMNQFDAFYSNNIDVYDAPKLSNTGENISLLRQGRNFSVESRNGIDVNDTIFYSISGMGVKTYEFDFVPYQITEPNLQGYLHDKFLGTETLISLTEKTTVSFTITSDARSKVIDRFYVTFRPNAILPVTFTSISATRIREKEVDIAWSIENEISMEKYEVERSLNGRDFQKIAEVSSRINAAGSGSYFSKDLSASLDDNFYRIKGISLSGRVQYTSIAKVSGLKDKSGIAIQPNPVVDKTMNIHFTNSTVGDYKLTIINSIGQVVYDSKIKTNFANCVINVKVDKLPRGVYQVRLNGLTKFTQRILID